MDFAHFEYETGTSKHQWKALLRVEVVFWQKCVLWFSVLSKLDRGWVFLVLAQDLWTQVRGILRVKVAFGCGVSFGFWFHRNKMANELFKFVSWDYWTWALQTPIKNIYKGENDFPADVLSSVLPALSQFRAWALDLWKDLQGHGWMELVQLGAILIDIKNIFPTSYYRLFRRSILVLPREIQCLNIKWPPCIYNWMLSLCFHLILRQSFLRNIVFQLVLRYHFRRKNSQFTRPVIQRGLSAGYLQQTSWNRS